ncbi:MAG: glycoside hydrolase family 3 C-terminal domain-containing protein [Pseudomonadota bacterium]
MLKTMTVSLLALHAASADDQMATPPDSLDVSERVEQLLSTLPTEDKVKLLTGIGFSIGKPLPGTDNFMPGVAGYTWLMPEHGLPSMVLSDGPAGVRFATPPPGQAPDRLATAFPIATVVSSSWDGELAFKMGEAMGREARSYGIDIILAPGMNLHRDPLGGRNYEYYSEDPLLTGKTAAAAVQGIQSTGVGATIKHFVANNQETNRPVLDTIVDERTLRELYLRPFEIAVKEGKPRALMTAYNLLNGTHTSQDSRLNLDILRDEWGFDGIVMTDWFAGDDPAAQVAAGHSLLMPGTDRDRASISSALEDGRLDMDALDQALRPTLRAVLETDHLEMEPADFSAHAVLAREVASAGTVLLKNDSVLPIDAGGTLAVFGVGAYDTISGGTGSGDVAEAYTISIAQGLEGAGYIIDDAVAERTEAHVRDFNAALPPRMSIFDPVPRVSELVLDPAVIAAASLTNDAAVVTLSRLAGEFVDRAVADDFRLTDDERVLIKIVSASFREQGKPVIAVLNVGGPIETATWRDDVDAIVVPWMGGQEAGHGVADVLSGVVNPSGHLPMTWPAQYADVSTAENFPGQTVTDTAVPTYAGFGQGVPSRVEYQEGLFVGYRHFDRAAERPAYAFGYGLSYTDFDYGRVRAALVDDALNVIVDVANTGDVAGRDVVQVYVSAPASEGTPLKELRGFTKTDVLSPGEKLTAEISVPMRTLAAYNAEDEAWVVAPGRYRVHVATDAETVVATKSIRIKKEYRF